MEKFYSFTHMNNYYLRIPHIPPLWICPWSYAELGTRYFKSNDDVGSDTLLKSTVGIDSGSFLKK